VLLSAYKGCALDMPAVLKLTALPPEESVLTRVSEAETPMKSVWKVEDRAFVLKNAVLPPANLRLALVARRPATASTRVNAPKMNFLFFIKKI